MRLRSGWATATICFLAAALPGAAAASDIQQGPDGKAFYVLPEPLPEGERGDVLRSRPLEGTMALPSAARNTLVLYYSVNRHANGALTHFR